MWSEGAQAYRTARIHRGDLCDDGAKHLGQCRIDFSTKLQQCPRVKERMTSAVVRLLTSNFAVAGISAAAKAPAFLPALTSL
jgi:hypothetical protein